MSSSTRCPACRTQFLVTPELLALSQGWVRCGTCAEIFDASAHLQDAADGAAARSEATALSSADLNRLGEISEPSNSVITNIDPESLAHPPAARDYRQDAIFGVQPTVSFPPREPDTQAEDSPQLELQEMGFVRQAQRQAVWRKPSVVALLLLSCLLLGGVLGLQVTVQERDRIAALDLRARPYLEKLCIPLGCRLAPLRQIESIVIDNSSFNKAPGDYYRFNLTIKNTSSLVLAMPSVELVLTDSQDQPQVRRVLMPAELGAPEQLAASSEWSATLPVALRGDVRVAGYRALVFYP
ncbi:MAG: zinc-ribbon and DUF3426 domain-containing protein [Burkholderiales bacterium]